MMLGDFAYRKESTLWWVLCRIEIYDIYTKQTAVFTEEELVSFDEKEFWSDFIWSDGNNACDCNRHLMWARALGLSEPENLECSSKRFIITDITRLDTGERLYGEREWIVEHR